MKTVFVGTVHGSRVALEALVQSGQKPSLIITLPADAKDRHSDYVDLTEIARHAGISVYYARNINGADTINELRKFQPDLCMVIGWSQICSTEFLSLAKLGNIGFHPSPLPRFRGRAVIPWTILQNERESGSSLFWLDKGTDTGDLLMQSLFELHARETARSLYDKHTGNLAAMLPRAIAQIANGTANRTAQDHTKASYCAKRTPGDGLINWVNSAETNERFIRAVGYPYPGAFSFIGAEKIVFEVARPVLNEGRFIGLVGQVQASTSDNFTVMCGDGNLLEVLQWRSNVSGPPKVHSKFGGVAS